MITMNYNKTTFGSNFLDKYRNTAITTQTTNPISEIQSQPTIRTGLTGSNLLSQYLENIANANKPVVKPVSEINTEPVKPYKNDLRTLFLTNNSTPSV